LNSYDQDELVDHIVRTKVSDREIVTSTQSLHAGRALTQLGQVKIT